MRLGVASVTPDLEPWLHWQGIGLAASLRAAEARRVQARRVQARPGAARCRTLHCHYGTPAVTVCQYCFEVVTVAFMLSLQQRNPWWLWFLASWVPPLCWPTAFGGEHGCDAGLASHPLLPCLRLGHHQWQVAVSNHASRASEAGPRPVSTERMFSLDSETLPLAAVTHGDWQPGPGPWPL